MTATVAGESKDADISAALGELRGHVTRVWSPDRIEAVCRVFSADGHVKLPELVPPGVKRIVADEVDDLIAAEGVRRELAFAETGFTPRRMRNVTREAIAARAPFIPRLYGDPALLAVLSAVAGEPVLRCPYEPEQFLITCLERDGDTHGWHWDDYSFALVWVIDTPHADSGGFVECVPKTLWDRNDPRIDDFLERGPVHRIDLAPGDLYLMRTDTTLHRVAPISSGIRKIVNMGYASSRDVACPPVSHETMDRLWSTSRADQTR
ncbi:hypothetical protein [Nocardia sp. XZ_19_385]|uniref:HalD/BesD family halogenase n=1 Tax=Nocardia sp. XZ_19_385 TaxID=2769488 RepID=UPI001E3DCECA|nr:hypothetical protein [Nocardia sp. XZ_19_385]